MAGGTAGQIFQAMLMGPLMSIGGDKKMRGVTATPAKRDLELLGELVQAGKIVPVIDRCFPFNEIPDALRYLGEGHARGKIVITVMQDHQES